MSMISGLAAGPGRLLRRLRPDEAGLARLGFAILLLGMANAGAATAYLALEQGGTAVSQVQEAVTTALRNAGSGVMVRGAVVVTDRDRDGLLDPADEIAFTVSALPGGAVMALDPAQSDAPVLNYSDSSLRVADVPYTARELRGNGDTMLEDGELFEISISPPDGASLDPNEAFAIEIVPVSGGVYLLRRTLPAAFDAVTLLP